MIFEKEFSITDNMVDPFDHVKPIGYLDLFQSVAGEHANKLGIGANELREKNLAWVLLRMKYDVIKPVMRYQKVVVKTWPHKASRLEFDRDFEICDALTKELLVQGTSKWVIMNTETRRLERASLVAYPETPIDTVLYESFDKIDTKDIFFLDDYFYQVHPSDIDFVGHMNNSKYADVIDERNKRYTKHFEINYLHETKIPDMLEIERQEVGKRIYYRGKVDSTIHFVAMLELEEE